MCGSDTLACGLEQRIRVDCYDETALIVYSAHGAQLAKGLGDGMARTAHHLGDDVVGERQREDAGLPHRDDEPARRVRPIERGEDVIVAEIAVRRHQCFTDDQSIAARSVERKPIS